MSVKDSVEAELNKHFSKYEDPLWDDNRETKSPVFEVKRTKKGGVFFWKILSNRSQLFIIDGSILSDKETQFLLSVDGFNFIFSQIKSGISNLDNFMEKLNAFINNRK